LKDDVIPRWLVPIEEPFYQNDVAQRPKLMPTEIGVEKCNIGTEDNPKMIKLSKSLSPEMKQKYIHLMKEFSDVFSWEYKDLKFYDKGIIKHTIPIKEDQKPFKWKLQRINPVLLPLLEKEVRKLFDVEIIVPLRFSKRLANLVPITFQ